MKKTKKQDRQGVRTPADIEVKYNLLGIGNNSIDMTKIRLEIADMLGDLSTDIQRSIEARLEALGKETDQKIADALNGYLKTSDFDAYKESINATLAEHGQTLVSILQDIETATEERASIAEAVGALSDTVSDLSDRIDGLAGGDESLSQAVNNLTNTVNGLTGTVNNLSEAVETAESERDAIAGSVGTLQNSMSTLSDSVSRTEQDINDVEGDVEYLSERVTNLSNRVDELDGGAEGALSDYLIIPTGTDLNTVLEPGKYISYDAGSSNYQNCPTSTGTFLLFVDLCGTEAQRIQRLVYSSKAHSMTFERFYYQESWGEWVCVSDFSPDAKLLWSGEWYMKREHVASLAEAVSAQKNGIVIVFSEYNGGTTNDYYQAFFVPKWEAATHPYMRYVFTLTTGNFAVIGTKVLQVNDSSIIGVEENAQTGTSASGIKYTNNRFVMRKVIGV